MALKIPRNIISVLGRRSVLPQQQLLKGDQQIHLSSINNYTQADRLPIPDNIDPNEMVHFSPQRSRDINATAILSHQSNQFGQQIDITVESSADDHLGSYDCSGAVNLNSSMQSNVPSPFGGMHKFTHLNMPGGQWEQWSKFTSNDLQSAHYINLRQEVRRSWDDSYDAGVKGSIICSKFPLVNPKLTEICSKFVRHVNYSSSRSFHLSSNLGNNPAKTTDDVIKSNDSTEAKPSRQEQLKKAFKEYGSTIIIFHVTISLVSLGVCYVAVSSGFDVISIIKSFGLSEVLNVNVAAGASTFVVAYAIHKLMSPGRIAITLGSVPFIVKYLRRKGYLKAPVGLQTTATKTKKD